jgi:hypothetical protein
MKWLSLLKDLEHMFPQGTQAFPWGKFIVPREVDFSPGNNHVPREKELKLPRGAVETFFPQGTIMSNLISHLTHYAWNYV